LATIRAFEGDDDMQANLKREATLAQAPCDDGGEGFDDELGQGRKISHNASLPLMKVRVGACVDVVAAKLEQVKKESEDKVAGIVRDSEQTFANNAAGKATFLEELVEKKARAFAFWDKELLRIQELRTRIDTAQTPSLVASLGKMGSEIAKTLRSGVVKEFTAAMSSYGRTKACMRRSSEAAMRVQGGNKRGLSAVAKANAVTATESPIYKSIMALTEAVQEESSNVAASYFETKAGARPCMLEDESADVVADLYKLAYIKSVRRQAQAQIDLGHGSSFQVLEHEAKSRAVLKRLRKSFNSQCFSTLAMQQRDWTITLWRPALFVSEAKHTWTGMTHFACINSRVLLEGLQYVYGMKTGDIEGVDMRDKKNCLMQMAAETMAAKVVEKRAFF
jgi:hypothetical protein